MKKLYLLVLITLLVSNIGFLNAQEVSVIRAPITLTQGYLLLEPAKDIDYWEIEVIIRMYQDDINYTKDVAEAFEIIGNNYFVIPNSYVSIHNAYIRVTCKAKAAHNQAHLVLASALHPTLEKPKELDSRPSRLWNKTVNNEKRKK